VIGSISFTNIVRGVFSGVLLGYGLAKEFEGKGFMFESLTAAIDFVFTQLNLHRVMANYVPSNTRSARILQRLGFTQEGIARDYLFLGGRWQITFHQSGKCGMEIRRLKTGHPPYYDAIA